MTRDVKIGLVVSCSFLTLVAVVVTTKMKEEGKDLAPETAMSVPGPQAAAPSSVISPPVGNAEPKASVPSSVISPPVGNVDPTSSPATPVSTAANSKLIPPGPPIAPLPPNAEIGKTNPPPGGNVVNDYLDQVASSPIWEHVGRFVTEGLRKPTSSQPEMRVALGKSGSEKGGNPEQEDMKIELDPPTFGSSGPARLNPIVPVTPSPKIVDKVDSASPPEANRQTDTGSSLIDGPDGHDHSAANLKPIPPASSGTIEKPSGLPEGSTLLQPPMPPKDPNATVILPPIGKEDPVETGGSSKKDSVAQENVVKPELPHAKHDGISEQEKHNRSNEGVALTPPTTPENPASGGTRSSTPISPEPNRTQSPGKELPVLTNPIVPGNQVPVERPSDSGDKIGSGVPVPPKNGPQALVPIENAGGQGGPSQPAAPGAGDQLKKEMPAGSNSALVAPVSPTVPGTPDSASLQGMKPMPAPVAPSSPEIKQPLVTPAETAKPQPPAGLPSVAPVAESSAPNGKSPLDAPTPGGVPPAASPPTKPMASNSEPLAPASPTVPGTPDSATLQGSKPLPAPGAPIATDTKQTLMTPTENVKTQPPAGLPLVAPVAESSVPNEKKSPLDAPIPGGTPPSASLPTNMQPVAPPQNPPIGVPMSGPTGSMPSVTPPVERKDTLVPTGRDVATGTPGLVNPTPVSPSSPQTNPPSGQQLQPIWNASTRQEPPPPVSAPPGASLAPPSMETSPRVVTVVPPQQHPDLSPPVPPATGVNALPANQAQPDFPISGSSQTANPPAPNVPVPSPNSGRPEPAGSTFIQQTGPGGNPVTIATGVPSVAPVEPTPVRVQNPIPATSIFIPATQPQPIATGQPQTQAAPILQPPMGPIQPILITPVPATNSPGVVAVGQDVGSRPAPANPTAYDPANSYGQMASRTGGHGGDSTTPTLATKPGKKTYSEKMTLINPEDDSFEKISLRYYNTDRYANALRDYNKTHPQASSELRQGQVKAGDWIRLPQKEKLDELTTPAPSAPAATGGTMPVEQVLQQTGFQQVQAQAPTPLPQYTVKNANETFYTIAQAQYGSGERWAEIAALNPNYRSIEALPAGVVIKLPASNR